MPETRSHEILRILATPRGRGVGQEDPRVDVLVEMIFDLLVEVEALRETLATAAGNAGRSAYARAYERSAYLTHNAAGPSSGWEKMLDRFYSNAQADDDGGRRGWRECLMLRRLGLSEEEIQAYRANARSAEMFT